MSRHYRRNSRKRRLSTASALRTDALSADSQWREYFFYLFTLCAARTIHAKDEMLGMGLRTARWEQLITVADAVSGCSHEELSEASAEGLDQARNALLASAEDVAADPAPHADNSHTALPLTLRHSAFRLVRALNKCANSCEACRDQIIDVLTANTTAETDGQDLHLPDYQLTPEFPDLPPIMQQLVEQFDLSTEQQRITAVLFASEEQSHFRYLLREGYSGFAVGELLAEGAAVDTRTFVRETMPGSRLATLGFIDTSTGRDEFTDITLSRPMLFTLRANTLEDLHNGLFSQSLAARHDIAEFPLPQTEVRNCIAALSGRQAILLSGAPGLGKTEFARSLIKAMNRVPHTLAASTELPVRSAKGAGTMRMNAASMAAHLLDPETDILLIDEADNILQSASGFFALMSDQGSSYDKAQLNYLLEELPVPTIWITNQHQMIPHSSLRRFGHVVVFPHPPASFRQRLLHNSLQSLSGDDCDTDSSRRWTHDLAARYDLTPAVVERTARIVAAELENQTICSSDVPARASSYIDQLCNSDLAQDVRRLQSVDPNFRPELCSTSSDLQRTAQLAIHRAAAGRGLRLLLDGPPGGGKTQFALWLARYLDRDVQLVRPSDLLSMYVGESEKQIAAAFQRARKTGSVLIIDEADALLYDRNSAVRSWEQSQIAEFLQQIQEFDGILAACTNRVDAVDPALRRRFHHHIHFGPIAAAQLTPALAWIFPEVDFSQSELDFLLSGPPLMMSDLAAAKEMLEIETEIASGTALAAGTAQLSPAAITAEILTHAGARDRTKRIGF